MEWAKSDINILFLLTLTLEFYSITVSKGIEGFLLLPPAKKLGQGYIFTGICDSVHRGGGAWSGGVPAREGGGFVCSWGCLVPGVPCLGAGCLVVGGCLVLGVPGRPPGMATAEGCTHPTGMHSCYNDVGIDLPNISGCGINKALFICKSRIWVVFHESVC